MASKPCQSPIADLSAKAGKISMDFYASPTVHIKILVGKEKTEFHLSKELLCHFSEFFKRACNESWESGRTNTIILDEEDPAIFSIFATWLARGSLTDSAELFELPEVSGSWDSTKSSEVLEVPDISYDELFEQHLMSYKTRFLQLAKCFVLGDYLQSVKFRNDIMDLLIVGEQSVRTVLRAIPSAKIVHFTWENTLSGSPLRHFILDIFINDCSPAELEEAGSLGTTIFYRELAGRSITFVRESSIREVWRGDRCRYHQHFDWGDAASCKELRSKEKSTKKIHGDLWGSPVTCNCNGGWDCNHYTSADGDS